MKAPEKARRPLPSLVSVFLGATLGILVLTFRQGLIGGCGCLKGGCQRCTPGTGSPAAVRPSCGRGCRRLGPAAQQHACPSRCRQSVPSPNRVNLLSWTTDMLGLGASRAEALRNCTASHSGEPHPARARTRRRVFLEGCCELQFFGAACGLP
jgi:hypothetical protein